MKASDLLKLAESQLEHNRSVLLIDPFIKISIEIKDSDLASQVHKDNNYPLSWIISLSPDKHRDEFDINLSLFDSILQILFDEVSHSTSEKCREDAIRSVIVRLATSLSQLYEYDEEDEEDYGEE